MSAAIISGHCYQHYWAQIGDSTPLAEEMIAMFGVRDLSPEAERERLEGSAIQVVEWRDGRPDRDVLVTLDKLARRAPDAYLHVDFDAFAPELAPGIADEPVPGGLTLEHAETIIRATGERFRIRAATLATYAPDRDPEQRTLRVALTLIELLAEYASNQGRAGPSDVACACRPHGQPRQGASIVEDLADPAGPFDSGIAQDEPREVAIWLRPEPLSGVEALQATFLRHRYRPHAHPTWVVALMRRGAAAFDLEGHHHLAPPGSVFIVAPELVHTGDPVTEAGYSYEVLYLTPELVAAAADGAGGREPRLPRHVVVDDPPLARRLRALHACLRRGDSGLEAEERFVVAAAFLCRQLEPAPREVRGPIRHRAVRRAVELLRERWAEPVTLPELAVHAGLSPSALVRQFHRELGLPPHSFQLNLRIVHARELLRRGRAPAEVALETGFYDQAHLTRVFKRAVGVPPQRFANA